MNRSTLSLVGACLMCFLVPTVAEAGLLRHGKADICIGVDHASKKPGADLKQFPCDGSLNQRWTRNLVNKKSELRAGAARVAHDTQLEQVACGNVHVFSAGD